MILEKKEQEDNKLTKYWTKNERCKNKDGLKRRKSINNMLKTLVDRTNRK